MIITGIQGANQPEMFRLFKDGIEENKTNIKTLSNLFMLQVQIIVAASILPTMLYLDYFYETEVKLAAGLIGIIFIRFLLKAQYLIFALPLLFVKRTRPFLYLNLGSLILNLILNYLFQIWMTLHQKKVLERI